MSPLPPAPSPWRGRGSAQIWLFTFRPTDYRGVMRRERGFIGPNHTWPLKRERAKQLRREATPAEKKAWTLLRTYRGQGLCFRRQQVIDGFIVDFFCARLRLVLELDGASHDSPEAREYDRARDAHLESQELTVVRLRNAEVSAESLAEIVTATARTRGFPLPRQGEGDRG